MKTAFMLALFGVFTIGLGPPSAVDGAGSLILTPVECTDCPEGYHCGGQVYRHSYGNGSSGTWAKAGSTDDCITGSCAADFHTTCIEEEDSEQVTSLFEVTEALDKPELRAMLAVNEGILAYNAERHSLQLLGCDDAIIANVPLRAALLGAEE